MARSPLRWGYTVVGRWSSDGRLILSLQLGSVFSLSNWAGLRCLLFIEEEGENPRVFSTWVITSRASSLRIGSGPGMWQKECSIVCKQIWNEWETLLESERVSFPPIPKEVPPFALYYFLYDKNSCITIWFYIELDIYIYIYKLEFDPCIRKVVYFNKIDIEIFHNTKCSDYTNMHFHMDVC